jgi:hypothetical protein
VEHHAMPGHEMGFHGMLVLGKQDQVYLLHLAMRSHARHQVQLILRVDLEAGPATQIGDRTFVGDDVSLEDTSANSIYFGDRNHAANDVDVYTFAPGEAFPLLELLNGTRDSFGGDFIRGHFERDVDHVRFLRNVTVRVKHILYKQQLEEPASNAPSPLDEGRLEYLLFGAGHEFFISHKITLHGTENQPDDNAFHQLFAVRESTAERLNFDLLRKAAIVEIDATHATSLGHLPDAGGTFPGRVQGLIRDGDTPLPLELELHAEHYLEVLM